MNENVELVPYTDDDYDFVYEVKKNAYKKYVEECWGSWNEEEQQKYFANENKTLLSCLKITYLHYVKYNHNEYNA